MEWIAPECVRVGPSTPRRAVQTRSSWRASDTLLVQFARLGSKLAFDCLWMRHAPAVHAVLLTLTPPDEADDLLQDVALCAWRNVGTLREGGRFPAWACSIARHRGRDWARAHTQRVALRLDEVPEPEDAPPRETDEADAVLAAVRSIPACYAEPLTMKLMLGFTNHEIAERTGMTPGSIRVNLHRGMRRLRQALGAHPTP